MSSGGNANDAKRKSPVIQAALRAAVAGAGPRLPLPAAVPPNAPTCPEMPPESSNLQNEPKSAQGEPARPRAGQLIKSKLPTRFARGPAVSIYASHLTPGMPGAIYCNRSHPTIRNEDCCCCLTHCGLRVCFWAALSRLVKYCRSATSSNCDRNFGATDVLN